MIRRKLITGLLPKKKQKLEQWLAASDEHHRQEQLISQIWDESKKLPAPPIPNIDDQWRRMKDYILQHNTAAGKQSILGKMKAFFGYQPSYRLAIGFTIIVLFVGIGSWYFLQTLSMEKITLANAQRSEFSFSDGSTVFLNSGSMIKFKRNFSDNERKVYLDGEAFFDIVTDGRTFVIETQNASITVVGTAFNVWSRNEETRILVKTGTVELKAKTAQEPKVVLIRGQQSHVSLKHAPTAPEEVTDFAVLGWMQGKIVFENTSLKEVAAELERYYDTTIRLSDRQLYNRSLTATFDGLSLEDAIKAICISLNIDYQFKHNVYILYPSKSR